MLVAIKSPAVLVKNFDEGLDCAIIYVVVSLFREQKKKKNQEGPAAHLLSNDDNGTSDILVSRWKIVARAPHAPYVCHAMCG